MINTLKSLTIAALLAFSSQGALADEFDDTREVFEKAGESQAYFENAYGYALFPTIGKAGLGIGGAHGKGRVYAQGKQTGTTNMTQVTIGWQAGGQAYSQVIFFENQTAYHSFISGNFEFSAQATAVAITAGAGAQANTGGGSSAGVSGGKNDASTASLGYRKGMAIFTVAKGGLMYEASLGGQKYNYKPL
jgi:lipid-binding SYLF domain-containing protein